MTIFLAANFHVKTPLHCLLDFIESIDAHTIAAASDGDENPSVLHDDDTLERHAPDEGVRLRCRRRNERQDVETLGVA